MKASVLFVNTTEPRCGVHQYGQNLYDAIGDSLRYAVYYHQPESERALQMAARLHQADVIIYNWSPNIGGWMGGSPFQPYARHHIAVYHDGHIPHESFDAILFSDPTMPQHSNWYPIGRPVPRWEVQDLPMRPKDIPWIGINGFLGAWAVIGVRQILHEFPKCKLRLHLPAAVYGDPDGAQAAAQIQACANLVALRPETTLEVRREFLPMPELLQWLSDNDLNVYARDAAAPWRGVSSVLDPALAVRRPIAVNLCSAFRHVHNLQPSICIEHNSLRTILENGVVPLLPLYKTWGPEAVRRQVEDVLDRVIGVATP